jgi:hypothetical protein
MNDLAQAVAFLESFNLAHGDLRPENVLLDRDRLKLSDFDCTAEIGTDFEACIAPYGRILSGDETNQGRRGTSGFLGPRTEQFALGSLYYLINYGFEVYGDRCLAEDPKEHGPKVVGLLQIMEFPNLDSDPIIDNIIDRCWHNQYATVAELAVHTDTFLTERTNSEGINAETTRWPIFMDRITRWLWSWGRLEDWESIIRQSTYGKATNAEEASDREHNGDSCDDEDLSSKRAICQDLEKRRLLQLLSSGEPEKLGFTFEWYRHTS